MFTRSCLACAQRHSRSTLLHESSSIMKTACTQWALRSINADCDKTMHPGLQHTSGKRPSLINFSYVASASAELPAPACPAAKTMPASNARLFRSSCAASPVAGDLLALLPVCCCVSRRSSRVASLACASAASGLGCVRWHLRGEQSGQNCQTTHETLVSAELMGQRASSH